MQGTSQEGIHEKLKFMTFGSIEKQYADLMCCSKCYIDGTGAKELCSVLVQLTVLKKLRMW